MKINWAVLVSALLLITALLSPLSCSNKAETPTPTPTSTPTATPTPTSVPLLPGWTLYHIDTFQIALPDEWLTIEVSPQIIDAMIKNLGQTNPQFVPYLEALKSQGSAKLWAIDSESKPPFFANIQVGHEIRFMSLDQYLKLLKNQLELMAGEDLSIVSSEKFSLNGHEAMRIEVSLTANTANGEPQTIGEQMVIVDNASDRYSIILAYPPDSSLNYKDLFDSIIHTFNIVNTSTPTPTPSITPTLSTEAILDEIATSVSSIRELSLEKEILPKFLTDQEFKSYIEKDFADSNPADELRIDKEELVILDLLNPDYDLATNLLELNKEQVIGFYNTRLSEMVILGDLQQIGPEEKVVFAHEYTHALQDQNFDLKSLPLWDGNDSDLSLAAQAVVEGDATLAMSFYSYQNLSPSELEEIAQNEEGQNEVLDSSPAVVRETLLFPYLEGTSFVNAIFAQGGWEAVDQLYSDLPKSTEQIIHPDRYLAKDEPQNVTIPDIKAALGEGWSLLDTDVLGELYLRIYLEAYVDSATAAKASEGWGGDSYAFWEDAGKRHLMVVNSAWDTPQDAQEFFDAYLVFVNNKSGGSWSVRLNAQDKRWWDAADESVYLSKQGNDVLLVIAPDETTIETILPKFTGF